MQLQLTNVINISVSAAQTGINDYNTSNLAIFTLEQPGSPFTDGFQLYLDPKEVGDDFGTSSQTFQMANAVFSQQPNILAGGGSLVVIPLLVNLAPVVAQQLITFSSVPTTGSYKLNYGVNQTGSISTYTAAALQTALRLLPGLSSITVTGDTTVGMTVVFTGVTGPATLLTSTSDSLQDSGSQDVFLTIITTVIGQAAGTETLDAAIVRTEDLVQYFGIISNKVQTQADTLAAAAVVQALNKIVLFVSRTEADIEPGGTLDLLRSGGFDKSRGLYYGTTTDILALVMMASYAGRAFSTNFSGSNTTSTMHLKDLVGVQPDPTMTQTFLTKALAAGADTYVSLQGVAKVFCAGANRFFDQVYNQEWFVGALQVAGFNFLAESSTKIPQTEAGMDGLKGAYRNVCEQAVTNQYSAPGTWNSPTTFGNQADLIKNIGQRGYYIFSQPVGQQSQTDRAARKAPLVQIALKEAGAIQQSSVVVYVNA